MKSLDRAITRFCYKHPRFGIRNLMLYLVAASGIAYIFGMMDTTHMLFSYLNFNPPMILRGQIWRLVTFLLMPIDPDNIFFELISLYFYYFIGSSLERQWGTGRFTIYYFTGVLLNIIFGFASYYIPAALGSNMAILGAAQSYLMTSSYLNLSMFFAFASIWPDQIVLLFFIIPIKMKWLAIVDAAFFLISIIMYMSYFPFNLLPLVAILNFFLFCGSNLFGNFRRDRNVSRRRAQWNNAVHYAENEEKVKNYRHKCAVCGRTDVTNPELEFRYCSKCQGYHCFCEDHINSHIHFTE